MVVVDQRGEVGGVRADHAERADALERQDTVVFEQHDAFARGVERGGDVLGAADRLVADLVERAIRIKQPQPQPRAHHVHAALGDDLFRDQPALAGGDGVRIADAAVQIAAVVQRQRGGFEHVVGHAVVLVEVEDRPAVGGHIAVKAPLFAQDVAQQQLAAAARLAVDAVVRAHHALDARLGDELLKRGQVRLPEVLLADHGVEFVALVLRTGVHGEVLGAGRGLHVALFVLLLKRFDELRAELAGQIGILAIRLVAAAPARIAKDVDIGRPEGQALVDVAVAARGLRVVLCAPLGGDDLAHAADQRAVKRRRHADRLREHRGRAGARHAMQRLVPPVVRGNSEPGNGRGVVAQHGRALFKRHLGDELARLFGESIRAHVLTAPLR